jgi:hypothetical protein
MDPSATLTGLGLVERNLDGSTPPADMKVPMLLELQLLGKKIHF